MILKKINKSLKRRTLRKKGGSGKRLNLNIEDEKAQKLYVPVEEDKYGNLEYGEDVGKNGNFAKIRADGKTPVYKPEWREKFDQIAINFKPKRGGKRKHKRYSKKGGYDSDSDSGISSLEGEEWGRKDKSDINNFLMAMGAYINKHPTYSKHNMISFINYEINQLDPHDLYYKMEYIINYIKNIPIEEAYSRERKEKVLSALEHIFINIENTRTDSDNVSPFSPNESPVQEGGTQTPSKIKLNFLGDDDSKSSINEPILRKKDSKWKRMSKYLRERVRKRTPTSIPEEDEKDEYYEDVDYPVKYGALDRCVRGECCGKGCSIMGGTRRKVYRSRKTRKNRKRRR